MTPSRVTPIVSHQSDFVNGSGAPGKVGAYEIYPARPVTNPPQATREVPGRAFLGGQENVLVVDDEPAILRVITTMLEHQGYTVFAAGAPGEAIRMATEHSGEIHLLVTDVIMPEMTGRELSKQLQSLYPNLRCLFMSGYTADVICHHGVLEEGVNFIQKPFSRLDLAVKIRDVLSH